ncbi:MAG: tetratricopeptide repeat protein [Nitrospinae bacterium]|nr:tetratricopeptide repeat protein [Nitrospinota bacterium]
MTRGMRPHTEEFRWAPQGLAGALVCAVLFLFTINTIERNRDWLDGVLLWEKTVRQSPQSSRANRNLRIELRKKGRYDEAKAESLYKRALAIREKALGPDHPLVAQSLNNLAALYLQKGKYTKAEPLFERALAIREKALGPDHPHVATSLNNLAALYLQKGKYTKAEPLFERALAIREKALEPDHPYLVQSLKNLAALYQVQGQYPKAEPLYKWSLSILEKTEPNHPKVATTMEKLAGLYKKMGREDEAKKLLDRAKRIRASQ